MNTDEKQYWDWFQQTGARIMYLSKLSKKEKTLLHEEIMARTRACCGDEVMAEVVTDEENDRAFIIFTAYGADEYFDRIENLVAAAPPIKGWKFFALYPPMPANGRLSVDYPNFPLKAEQMLFTPDELTITDGEYNIEIYVEEVVPIDDEMFEVVGVILFNVLGEKVMTLNMGEIGISYLETVDPVVREKLLPLPELANYVSGNIQAPLSVDGSGKIRTDSGVKKE
jgi:hypothetical protein